MSEVIKTRPGDPRRGLTLVELLVVLTILAIMATVAVTSTQVIVQQGRFEATQRTLTNVEEAILGPANQRQPDGTIMMSGFVADLGRLPIAFGSDPAIQLAELWDNDKNRDGNPDLDAFDLVRLNSDPEVLVPYGWRGVYLQLPLGTDQLRDGWGNRFDLLRSDMTPVADGESIEVVRSRGADGVLGGDGYDRDLELFLAARFIVTVGGNVYLLDADGQRQNPPSANDVTVRLYGPNPLSGELESSANVTRNNDNGVCSYAASTTIGARFIRAYYGSSPTRASRLVPFSWSGVIHLDIP
jgi:prepilin-type N-terminal cleavage/methylation domain-containing protein